MIAEVKLNDVDDKLYGKLLARVTRVWNFPSSTEEMFKVIGNKTLVNYLAQRQQTAPIQVLLEPLYDPNTPTGFLWTSKSGPPFLISSGAVGEITVLLETRRPIEYVFPIFRTIKETIILMKLKNYAK
jgi:HlyD family secretion protein